MKIRRSTGTTLSEKRLARLCEDTFLSLWTYPNIFRDQGARGSKAGHGKEICDLLVVCDNDVIIFSDKSCAFPRSGDPDRDWRRWFTKSILRSAKQLYGAERWLREHPDRVFVDRACTQRLPIPLSVMPGVRIHRVVVARGAAKRCREACSGSGSLYLSPELVGNDHVTPGNASYMPFAVGQVAAHKGYVHILDEVSLALLLRELDTVTDFLQYLRQKEKFLLSGKVALIEGEENLLGLYLKNASERTGHFFHLPSGADEVIVPDGFWQATVQDPAYLRKKNADKVSYHWDIIIQEFGSHALGGTLLGQDEESFGSTEEALRIMAKECRLHRRALGLGVQEALEAKPDKGASFIRTTKSLTSNKVVYVILCMDQGNRSADEYRKVRRQALWEYCLVVASHHKSHDAVVGIATESGFSGGRSYDLAMTQVHEWSEDLENQAKEIQRRRGIFNTRKMRMREVSEDEFPQDASGPTVRVLRDSPRPTQRHTETAPTKSTRAKRKRMRQMKKRSKRRSRGK